MGAVRQFRDLTEEERVKRLEQWADRIGGIAISMCIHAKSGDKDEFGHSAFPCAECVRVVNHVTQQWAAVFFKESERHRAAFLADRGAPPIMVSHHMAYRVAGALLEPAMSLGLDRFGPL
jgi:hypothetical protein